MNRELYFTALKTSAKPKVMSVPTDGYPNPVPPHERWLSTRDVKEMFSLSASTLSRLVKEKLLQVSKAGRKNLYNMQELLDYLNRGRE